MNERDLAQKKLVEALSQHSTYLFRASTGAVSRVLEALDSESNTFFRDIQDRLDGLTPAELSAFSKGQYTTSRLKGLRATIDGWAKALAQQIDDAFTDDAKLLAGHEASFARNALAGVLSGIPEAMNPALAYKTAMETPVLGELVKDAFKDITERTKKQVYATIRQGVAAGQSNSQIIRALRGTKALNYKDGILQSTRNALDTTVRTARAHISNTIYEQQWLALGVKTLVWSANLEMRTCRVCAPKDGLKFSIDAKFARPPLHPRCRCSLVPLINDELVGNRPFVLAGKVTGRDGQTGYRSIGNMTKKQREDAGLKVGQVSANTSFKDWFASQPERYQLEWLGSTKFKLYKDGGYTLDKFVDPQNKPYTIEQLRQKDSETFAEIFG